MAGLVWQYSEIHISTLSRLQKCWAKKKNFMNFLSNYMIMTRMLQLRLLVWALYSISSSCWCFCLCRTYMLTDWLRGCVTDQLSLLCVGIWGENKGSNLFLVSEESDTVIKSAKLLFTSNEVCEKSLLIKYRGRGRYLSPFIRKKDFSHFAMTELLDTSDSTVQSIWNWEAAAGGGGGVGRCWG